jgi:hypothetical protein
MAGQTNSLISQDSPQLTALLQSLHADLTVLGQHQDDLAQGVSYLGGALKGFQSIAYSGSTQVPWGNIFVNPASLSNTFSVIGPCGVLDDVLDEALGPDPEPCADQTGPLPGEGSNAVAGSGSPDSNAAAGSSTTSTAPPASATTSTTEPNGPNSGVDGLSQLLAPLLGGSS